MEETLQKPSMAKDDVRRPSFADTVKTVFAGAIGVRRQADHERAPLNPLHLVIAAVIFVVLFIFTLLTIVKIVLS
ncbi:MAG TPA: DUF2970 domain-containing protein [Burkholderiales bacterium]|nr:DUF2970 domain-containing protein [Burkholderiales bacterium]